MDKACGGLAFEEWPGLLEEHTLDFLKGWKGMKKTQHEPQARLLVVGQELHGNVVGKSNVNLAVANHPITAILEAGKLKAFDAHPIPQCSFQSE
jgi:hypothetical protein